MHILHEYVITVVAYISMYVLCKCVHAANTWWLKGSLCRDLMLLCDFEFNKSCITRQINLAVIKISRVRYITYEMRVIELYCVLCILSHTIHCIVYRIHSKRLCELSVLSTVTI